LRYGSLCAGARKTLKVDLIDCISVGVDRMQRNFELIRKQVDFAEQE
jgi:hypothetical protein